MRTCNLFLVTILLTGLSLPALTGEYVVLLRSGVNLRTQPQRDAIVIGEASKGSIFLFHAEAGDWLVIEMFSGEKRFVSKSYAARISTVVPQHHYRLPDEMSVRRELCRRIRKAEARAMREAAEIVPATLDADKHHHYLAILTDRYILKAFHNAEVHPGLYNDLMAEARARGW